VGNRRKQVELNLVINSWLLIVPRINDLCRKLKILAKDIMLYIYIVRLTQFKNEFIYFLSLVGFKF